MLDCICLSAPFHNNHRFTTHAVQEGIELRLCLRRDAYVFLACTFPSALHTVVNGKKRLNFIQTPPKITGYRGLVVLVQGFARETEYLWRYYPRNGHLGPRSVVHKRSFTHSCEKLHPSLCCCCLSFRRVPFWKSDMVLFGNQIG